MFVLGGGIVTAKRLTLSLWDSKIESHIENVSHLTVKVKQSRRS